MEVRLCHLEMEQDRRDGVPVRGADLGVARGGVAWEVIEQERDRAACVSALPVVNEHLTRLAFPATGSSVRVAGRR